MENVLLKISLFLLLALPLLAAGAIAIFGQNTERITSRLASLAANSLPFAACLLLGAWWRMGFPDYQLDLGDLYHHGDYTFPLVIFLDKVSAVFLAVTAFLATIIVRYCRYYLHREVGYARFFITILVFIFGMNFLVLSGTLDLLFAGWEIVGMSSFLLIGFYRDRLPPIRNALRTYSVYRLCDIGLLLAAWLGHFIWHASVRLSSVAALTPEMLSGVGHVPLLILCVLLLLAACGKSAQFPFCFWLSRAMEGPTPSSAIFYGALSIHAGVYLLMRTQPLWMLVAGAPQIVGAVGLLSVIVGTLSSRVQSNIKGQLAYASIVQVGLMLIELSFGMTNLALLHFAGNAFLRCYQLLISPSVVAHLLRLQSSASTGFTVSDWSIERLFPSPVRSTAYAFALNEGFLEIAIRQLVWKPVNAIARIAHAFDTGATRVAMVVIAVGAVLWALISSGSESMGLSAILMTLGVLAGLIAIAERQFPLRAWNYVAFSSVAAAASILTLNEAAIQDTSIYAMGVIPAWAMGLLGLQSMLPSGGEWDLRSFHGAVRRFPGASLAVFLGFLGVSGFPITPAFLGEDLLLHHAVGGHPWLCGAITAIFVLNGLTLARIFTRICLGPVSVH